MPKKNKFKGGGGGSRDRIVRTHFRFANGLSLSTSAGTYTVSVVDLIAANLGARVASMAVDFEFFRIKNLSIDGWSDIGTGMYDANAAAKQGTTLGFMMAAYDPESSQLTGTPTSIADFDQYRHVVPGNLHHRLKLTVGPKDTFGARPVKWFNTTTTGTPPKGQNSAGLVAFMTFNSQSTNNGSTLYYFVSGIVEFKGEVAPTLSKNVINLGPGVHEFTVTGGISTLREVRSLAPSGILCDAVERKDLVEVSDGASSCEIVLSPAAHKAFGVVSSSHLKNNDGVPDVDEVHRLDKTVVKSDLRPP